jgi:hypothetical protein
MDMPLSEMGSIPIRSLLFIFWQPLLFLCAILWWKQKWSACRVLLAVWLVPVYAMVLRAD